MPTLNRIDRLRQSLDQFLADLYAIRGALKTREGWAIFVLLAVMVGGLGGLFIVVLGFDHLFSVATEWGTWRPFHCKAPDNIQSVVIILGGTLITLLGIVALGEMFAWAERRKQKRQSPLRQVIIPVAAMLCAGFLVAAVMRLWC